MKRLLIWMAPWGLLLLCSCAGWQQTAARTVDVTARSSRALSSLALDQLDRRCLTLARGCKARGDTECAPLEQCQEERSDFGGALKRLYAAIDAARVVLVAAIAADGAEGWRGKALAAAAQLAADLERLRSAARKLGVKI